MDMRRTSVAGLMLALTFSALGGTTLAQAEPSAEPSIEPDPSAASGSTIPLADVTLPFLEPEWRRITPDKGPAAREDHTWTVDGDGRYAYLFGGRDGAREFGDLWRYDLQKDRWKKLTPKGASPSPRFGHSASWVEGEGLFVFAGQQGPDFFDELWRFDPGKGKWRRMPDAGQVPKRRYGSCMVVGPDGKLWISHGFTSAGRFEDTRAYNPRNERWSVLTPDGRKPWERCLHECFTNAAGELVLYGGQDDGAFAYIFGGAGEDDAALDDLWRVDRETLEFKRVRVDGRAPVGRFAGTLITDPLRGRLLLFGGQAAVAKADVWELVDIAEPPAEPSAEPLIAASAEPAAPSVEPVAEVEDPDEV